VDSDKQPLEDTWESHYVAWRETWLVGVEKPAPVEESTTPTTEETTPAVVIPDNPFTPEDESKGEIPQN
ncbi:MAG: hypothetical protein WCX88_04220, partial [Patescibacteria group bacterium]